MKPMEASNAVNVHLILFLCSIFCAAFFYEILILTILDRLGVEALLTKKQSTLMRVYGVMGVSAAVGLWIMSLMDRSMDELFLILIFCIILTGFMMKRKNDLSII